MFGNQISHAARQTKHLWMEERDPWNHHKWRTWWNCYVERENGFYITTNGSYRPDYNGTTHLKLLTNRHNHRTNRNRPTNQQNHEPTKDEQTEVPNVEQSPHSVFVNCTLILLACNLVDSAQQAKSNQSNQSNQFSNQFENIIFRNITLEKQYCKTFDANHQIGQKMKRLPLLTYCCTHNKYNSTAMLIYH